MEESTVRITPTLIFRASSGRIEIADVEVEGEIALLVFMDPEQAETFRRETGRYPASEGFQVRAVDPKGVRGVAEAASFDHVALRSGEETLDLFEADTIGEILAAALEEAQREAEAPGRRQPAVGPAH